MSKWKIVDIVKEERGAGYDSRQSLYYDLTLKLERTVTVLWILKFTFHRVGTMALHKSVDHEQWYMKGGYIETEFEPFMKLHRI